MNRFSQVSEEQINTLCEASKNKNKKHSTNTWINVFVKWAEWRNLAIDIEKYSPEELDRILCMFYSEIKTSKGDDYEPDCLAVMQASLDRYLKEHFYPHSITKSIIFKRSQEVLEGKCRLLRMSGKGKKPNATKALTKEEEEECWRVGNLGNSTPLSLIHTVYFQISQHFGTRARQEHVDSRVDNFKSHKDDNGTEYITFHEDPTKTRGFGLHPKKRLATPKMFATGEERCPVRMFNLYMSKRPESLKTSGPFYLGIKRNAKTNDDVWYLTTKMGKNTVCGFMKAIISGTSAAKSGKVIANHSARKTTVKKLKAAQLPDDAVIKITGHKNTAGLRAYDEGDEGELKKLSGILDANESGSSKAITCADANAPGCSKTFQENTVSTFGLGSVFKKCNVTINVNPKTTYKRKRVVIDSSESSQE